MTKHTLVLNFLNKVSNILLEITAATRYMVPPEGGTEDVAHKPLYYQTFFDRGVILNNKE
jgi:hypothetical protein